MDGWTIWIHLEQCVTLDPSFNYGKVTFIKRIQKVNYLLLRMEDERGWYVPKWQVSLMLFSFCWSLTCDIIWWCFGFEYGCWLLQVWWLLGGVWWMRMSGSGTLVQLTGWDCGRWSLILPQAESGPGSTGKGWMNTVWPLIMVSHQQFHAKCTIKAYQSTTEGLGAAKCSCPSSRRGPASAHGFAAPSADKLSAKSAWEGPQKEEATEILTLKRGVTFLLDTWRCVEIFWAVMICNQPDDFCSAAGHLWATGHHHHRTPPGDPVWSTGGLP